MGLISKRNKRKHQPAGTTIIAAGSKFRGELILDAVLHVDGTLEGSIESSTDVAIGETGSFDGNIRARHVVVSGYVHGKIECERLEIVPKGKVFGEVLSQEFVIEPGGQFIGESHIKNSQSAPALDHSVARPSPVVEALDVEVKEA
jgi:cytoskeletal protein CcmA (bactofilin family)